VILLRPATAISSAPSSAKLAENELADMMDATGNLSQDGRRRIEAALLTAAYGKSDLVQELFESTDTDIKAIGNALKVMSGQWAAMRQAAKDGSIDPATDMTANLIEGGQYCSPLTR
jgi:hypothetical protein